MLFSFLKNLILFLVGYLQFFSSSLTKKTAFFFFFAKLQSFTHVWYSKLFTSCFLQGGHLFFSLKKLYAFKILNVLVLPKSFFISITGKPFFLVKLSWWVTLYDITYNTMLRLKDYISVNYDINDNFLRGTYEQILAFNPIFSYETFLWLVFLQISLLVSVLIIIAYATLLERKVMASIQRRQGPNVTGIKGLLQPLADGAKLLLKEFFWPRKSYYLIYIFAAGLGLLISLYLWILLPFNKVATITLPTIILFILAAQIVETYSLILAGWASNSKYALLGSLRTAAQMISYELSLSFIILTLVFTTGSLDLYEIVQFQQNSCWFFIPYFPLFLLFLCSILAETNRTPFDLPEAEAELVAGYNVEYSGMLFALFFLAEYANMALLSLLTTILFLGGWSLPGIILDNVVLQTTVLGIKSIVILFFFVWVRATLPRYRYDQLMDLGWKVFLPITFGFFLTIVFIFYITGSLPLIFFSFF